MPRSVSLPRNVAGRLFLDAMPGRYEPFEKAKADIVREGVRRVVCLTSLEEVRMYAPDYAQAIESDGLAWTQQVFPIVDGGVPSDTDAFLDLAHSVAGCLRNGDRVVIHCAAGIGRTGMLAICVLMILAMTEAKAYDAVRSAGSVPEAEDQRKLVSRFADRL